jgi:hypothetical protein
VICVTPGVDPPEVRTVVTATPAISTTAMATAMATAIGTQRSPW